MNIRPNIKLKTVLLERGITQRDLAFSSNIDESRISRIIKGYEKPTSERNGVKVIIPVKYSDQYNFSRKIKEQLAYFQNVYFKVDGISNDFSIYRGENYQLSED